MKYLGTITLMLFLSTAQAQTAVETNRPSFGNQVPNRGTTTNNVRDSAIRSDSVGTGQSSTMRQNQQMNSKRNVAPVNQGTRATDPAYCLDSSGRSLSNTDSGFRACVNTLYGK